MLIEMGFNIEWVAYAIVYANKISRKDILVNVSTTLIIMCSLSI